MNLRELGDTLDRHEAVDLVMQTLGLTPDQAEQCMFLERGKARQLLEEGYIEKLGLWFAFDGSWISGDLGRGTVYPGWWQRRQLRAVIRKWRRNR